VIILLSFVIARRVLSPTIAEHPVRKQSPVIAIILYPPVIARRAVTFRPTIAEHPVRKQSLRSTGDSSRKKPSQ